MIFEKGRLNKTKIVLFAGLVCMLLVFTGPASADISFNYTNVTSSNYTITSEILNSENFITLTGGDIIMPSITLKAFIDHITLNSGSKSLELSSGQFGPKTTSNIPKHKIYTVSGTTANVAYSIKDSLHLTYVNISTYKRDSHNAPFFSDTSIALLDFDTLKTKWSDNATVLDELVNATSNKINETTNVYLDGSGNSAEISQNLPAGEYLILVTKGTDPKEIVTSTTVNVMPFSSTITVPSSAYTGFDVAVLASLTGAPSEDYTYISSIIEKADYADHLGDINISWTSGNTLAESVRINGTLINNANSLTDIIPGSYTIKNTTSSTSDTLTLDTSSFPAGNYWVHTIVFNNSNQSVAFDQSELTLSEQSNGTLKGTIIKSGTSIGISGATVTITNGTLGSIVKTTISDGTYSVSLYPAIYTVNVTKTGYSSNNTTSATVSSNSITTVPNIQLTTNTVTVTANSTVGFAGTGQNVSFNLTVVNSGDNATFTVTNSTTNTSTNVITTTTPSTLLLNTINTTGYVVVEVNNSNFGGWPVTITIANSSQSKSVSITLDSIMQNSSAAFTNLSSTNDSSTTVVDATLVNATITSNATVSGNSTIISNATITGSSSTITDGAVIKGDYGDSYVTNSVVGNATVQSTNLTSSTISGNASVSNSTLTSATVSNSTLTNVTITSSSTITNVVNLTNITIRGVDVTGVAAYDYEGELQGSVTAGSVEYQGINFSQIYANVRISQLVIEKSPVQTVTLNQDVTFSGQGNATSNANITLNLSSTETVNISETGINPEGADVPSDATRVGNFLNIEISNSSAVQGHTLRLYYTGSSVVKIWYYNTSATPSAWEALTTTGSGNESGKKYVEAQPNHASTFALLSTPSSSSSSSSTGGGGGGSSGGGGVTTSEPYENIEKAERYEKTLFAGKPVTYTFTAPEHGVSEIVITGEVNEYGIALRVEALKDTSKIVSASPLGVVYKNLNVWAGTKRIKEALIRFNVENSWLDSNNIAAGNVRMVRWDGSKWVQLDTTKKIKGTKYTSYEAKTGGFSSFAIVGLKEGEVIPTEAEATPTVVTPTEDMTPVPETMEEKKSFLPGFEMIYAIVGIFTIAYMLRREEQ